MTGIEILREPNLIATSLKYMVTSVEIRSYHAISIAWDLKIIPVCERFLVTSGQ